MAQPHCHHSAVMGWDADAALLQQAGAGLTQVGSCCGLAGNFGMERGHYEVSTAVAAHRAAARRQRRPRDAVVLADGFSCRTQLTDLAPRSGLHLAELLAGRLAGPGPRRRPAGKPAGQRLAGRTAGAVAAKPECRQGRGASMRRHATAGLGRHPVRASHLRRAGRLRVGDPGGGGRAAARRRLAAPPAPPRRLDRSGKSAPQDVPARGARPRRPARRATRTARLPVPAAAQAVSTAHPTRVIGNGTAASCTSRAVVAAVAAGGIITFSCGPRPVTITMTATAKVVNTSQQVVLDGGGKVTLSGGGKRRILYQNTCDQRQSWTTTTARTSPPPR